MEVVVLLEVVAVMEVPVLVVQILPDEPWNIPSLNDVEVSHVSPQSVCAKDDARKNMMFIAVTLDTSHSEMSLLNDDAEANMPRMSVTLDTSHLEMSPLNDDAEANMSSMVVTLDTSQSEMSPVNLSASGTGS